MKTRPEALRTRGRRRLASLLVPLLMLLSIVAAPLPVWAFDLPTLMQSLAGQRSGEAEFVEQRFVQGVDAPLTSSGKLSFAAPDRFVRHTLKPRDESMAVEGNNITLSRGGRSRRLTLDAVPEMVGLVEALRGTLTGNAQVLQRYFNTELSGSAEQWTLVLTPLESRLGAQLRTIRIGGRRAELSSIEMLLADGDRSVMTIVPAKP